MQFYGINYENSRKQSGRTITDRVLDTIQFLKPKPCPFPLTRLGGSKDGAYLLPDDLSGIQACFSPGTANFKNFEDELFEKFNISSHMCDKSSDPKNFKTPIISGKQTFLKKWLDVNVDDDSISLETWVNELAPGDQDLILQIDIEGAEYRNIINTPSDVLNRFRIIVIELHGLSSLNNSLIYEQVFEPFFEAIGRSHTCVHAHPNNSGRQAELLDTVYRIPVLLEVTLLRNDRIADQPCEKLIVPSLPNPLDLSRNVASKPPIFLDENWSEGPRNALSSIKLLQDQLEFKEYQLSQEYQLSRNTTLEETRKISLLLPRLVSTLLTGAAYVKEEVDSISLPKTDVAKGKNYFLGESYGTFPTRGLVEAKSPFFFHTEFGVGQSITIDLEENFFLQEIVISNRTNGYYERSANILAIAHIEEDYWSGAGFFFVPDPDFLEGLKRSINLTLPDVRARYVTLVSLLKSAIHLSDVQVYSSQKVSIQPYGS